MVITKVCIATAGIVSARIENGLLVIKVNTFLFKNIIDGSL